MIKILLIPFIFIGLCDTVLAYGLAQNNDMRDLELHGMNLNVRGSDFKTIVHAVAANENRYQFSRRSIYTSETDANSKNDKTVDGKYRLEKGFLGAHSDIGGGYANGDLSDVALMWMIKQAQEKGGIELNNQMIKDKGFDQINNPIVHDSVMALPVPVGRLAYTAGSEFRWATDSSYGYDEFSIFKNRSHLSLNWEDTKAFQNPNYKKFDKVQSITDKYMENHNAKNAIYPAMLTDPYVLGMLEYYKYQKDLGTPSWHRHIPILSLEDRNVLMANEKGKRIAIQDYITWLNHCGYGLNLKTDLKGNDLSKYSKEQLCNPKSLQSLIKTEKQGINGWVLLLFVMLGLSGCATTNTSNNKTQTTILFRMNDGIWTPESPDSKWSAVLKNNNAILQHCNNNSNHQLNYISWDLVCGTNLKNLETLKVQYAIIPWEKDKAWAMGLDNYTKMQAEKLPPSAWRTYTINPQQVVEKTKREVPARHPDNIKNYPIGKNGTIIKLTLYIDGNGNITQKIDHIIDIGWVHT